MTAAGALLTAEQRAEAVDIHFPPGATPTPDRGFRAHIFRFLAPRDQTSPDLEPAPREFYEAIPSP